MPDMGKYRYILIESATFSKDSHENEGSPHLDGDSMYRWAPRPSWKHAEADVVKATRKSFSILGNWSEFDVSRVDMTQWKQLVGEEVTDESGTYFAVVGSRA